MSTEYTFDDVVPLEIGTDENGLCKILYDEEYKKTMGILLSLMKNKEYSERALYMTGLGIELLASHYSIWSYRYNILLELKKDLFEELDWCEQIAVENEKNYQIWNYRQLIIEQILASGQEFSTRREYPILELMLASDNKNHHVWTYWKWMVERFELYNDFTEHDLNEKLIRYDERNNSAWTHRFFINFSHKEMITEERIRDEINFAKNSIEIVPQNISSWNYLRGIYKVAGYDIKELEEFCLKFADFSKIMEKTDDIERDDEIILSSFALELLGDIYSAIDKKKAVLVYNALSKTYDPIRANYWDYKISKLE